MLSTFRKSQLGIIAFISLFILVSCSDQDKKGGGTKMTQLPRIQFT